MASIRSDVSSQIKTFLWICIQNIVYIAQNEYDLRGSICLIKWRINIKNFIFQCNSVKLIVKEMKYLIHKSCINNHEIQKKNTEGVIKNGQSKETGNKGTQDEDKQGNNTTQYVWDTTVYTPTYTKYVNKT